MDIVIKNMCSDSEIHGKAFVHFKSWHETYTGLVSESYLGRITFEKCLEISKRWTDNVIVAKYGENVIGFAGFGKYRDDSLSDCGEIYSIYILREYQNQGIGSKLMDTALERLNNYKNIALWVLQSNEKAIKFYKKYGFEFDGTIQEILLGTPCVEARMIYRR